MRIDQAMMFAKAASFLALLIASCASAAQVLFFCYGWWPNILDTVWKIVRSLGNLAQKRDAGSAQKFARRTCLRSDGVTFLREIS